jgi:hypothetical protein
MVKSCFETLNCGVCFFSTFPWVQMFVATICGWQVFAKVVWVHQFFQLLFGVQNFLINKLFLHYGNV